MRCPRGRHAIAWLEVTDGRPVVVARGVSPGRERRSIVENRVSADELRGRNDEDQEPFEGYAVTTSCGCGGRFEVDLVAVLEGRNQVPVLDTTDYRDFGVSFDR